VSDLFPIAAGSLTGRLPGLASELLLGRYALHAPKEREGLLAKYEQGIFGEAREKLAGMPGGHRGREFDRYILPMCGQLVGALGQRMAYEAAKSSGLDHAILEFFEISCIANDLSWYNENAGLTRSKAADRQARALRNVLPLLPQLLDESEVAAYVTAPIINEKNQKTLWWVCQSSRTMVGGGFLKKDMLMLSSKSCPLGMDSSCHYSSSVRWSIHSSMAVVRIEMWLE